ncbi:uncharacterized protein I303_107586 [Kwoniella dejecticola CBS 10117]|uniref:Protein kinase domain-containing protein n=1 Tax=Kwoniella dejecticola CBS 10117 TaxID=1296121 RepID=A0A1A5ZV54_9TREE|nr:uncharacterized protein I303_07596 [Kwoniella dejecticola CBS 10117]OBR81686.1 hypothetical protein I303_07596 [Kwoniella dejecticola CBS 10117]
MDHSDSDSSSSDGETRQTIFPPSPPKTPSPSPPAPAPRSPEPESEPEPEQRETDFDQFDYLWLHFNKGIHTGRTDMRPLTGEERFLFVRYTDKYKPDNLAESGSNAKNADVTSESARDTDLIACGDVQPGHSKPQTQSEVTGPISFFEPLSIWVNEFVTTGQTWDVLRGRLGLNDGTAIEIDVIVKIMRPSEFPDEFPPDIEDPMGEDDGYNTTETAIAYALDDDRIYREHLHPNKELQGLGIVPRYYGLFEYYDSNDDQVKVEEVDEHPKFYMMVLEGVGREIEDARDGCYPWEWQDKLRIDALYEQLHRVGKIAHGNVLGQHVLKKEIRKIQSSRNNDGDDGDDGGDGCEYRLFLVDFQRAEALRDKRPKRNRRLIEDDLGNLEYLMIQARE